MHGHHEVIRQYLHETALKIFKLKASVLGWDCKPNEPSTDAVKRAVVLGMCVTAEDPTTLLECQKKFNSIDVETFNKNGIPNIAPELLGIVCIACIRHDKTDKSWKKIMKLHNVATLAADKRTFQNALGCTKDINLMKQTLDWSINSGMVRNQNMFVPVGSIGRTDSKRKINEPSIIWEWFTSSYIQLKEKKLSNSIFNDILSSSLIGFVRNSDDQIIAKIWLDQQNVSNDMLKTFEKCMEKVDIIINRRLREETVLLNIIGNVD